MAEKPKKKPRKPGSGRKLGGIDHGQRVTCTLTRETLDAFVAIVTKGNFRQVARQRLGIPLSTYNSWLESGRKQIRQVGEGKRKKILIQGEFVIAVDKAEGIVHGQMMEDILSTDSIHARQWFLERRFNKLYSRNPNAHIDDETGHEVKIDAPTLLAERLAALLGS